MKQTFKFILFIAIILTVSIFSRAISDFMVSTYQESMELNSSALNSIASQMII